MLEGSRQQAAEEKAQRFAVQGERVEAHITIRAAVGRALAGLDRATSLLGAGRGAEAALVLATEAARTRQVASEFPTGSSDTRILRGIAAHLGGRAEALRSGVPEHAEKTALRLQRLANATEARAARLEGGGQAVAAQLLRSIATDSQGQARLLQAGAANTDAVIGHGLARLGQRLTEAGLGRSLAGAQDAKAFAAAFGRLGEHCLETRQGLHLATQLPTDPRRLEQLAQKLASGALHRPELAALLLQRDERTRSLIAPLELLSVGLTTGDSRLVEQARSELQRVLRDLRALPGLKDGLQPELLRGTPSSFKELAARLPELLLSRLVDGGAGALARSGPGSLEQQLARLPGLPQDAPFMRPAERVVAELANAHKVDAAAGSLGPPESLLLGSQGFYTESGALSRYLREHSPVDGAASRFEVPRSDHTALGALSPAGPHESAVLVDRQGAVLVRGPGGFAFHEGHAVSRSGERYYFDVEPRTEGLRSVVYQSALPGSPPCVRVELDVTELGVEAISVGDEDDRKRKQRKRRRAAEGSTRGAVVAIFRDVPEPGGLMGFTSRLAAKLSLREVDRVNATLQASEHIRPLFSDVAAGVGELLSSHGAVHAFVFATYLVDALEAHGLDPEQTSALLFWLEAGGEELVHLVVPELKRPSPAAWLRPRAAEDPPEVLHPDRNRQPELVESSVLLLPTSVLID